MHFQTLTILVYNPLLIEVEFDFVSEHLPDAPDKFSSTVFEGIVVSPPLRPNFLIVSFEGDVILYNIVGWFMIAWDMS